MNTKFISGTEEQYSINENGIIHSHYKYLRSGEKLYRIIEMSKYTPPTRKGTSSVITLKFRKLEKYKLCSVNSLMKNAFNITKPDLFHFYDLVCIDGNVFNNSRSNLKYIIRTRKNYNYCPELFYDINGKIINKRCGICGETKDIKYFNLQPDYREHGAVHETYRNQCELCRSRKRWKQIKNDPKLLKKENESKRRWTNTIEGKKHIKKKRKEKHIYDRENLTRHYIATILEIYKDGLKEKDLTLEIIELTRKRILLHRKIKQLKTENHE